MNAAPVGAVLATANVAAAIVSPTSSADLIGGLEDEAVHDHPPRDADGLAPPPPVPCRNGSPLLPISDSARAPSASGSRRGIPIHSETSTETSSDDGDMGDASDDSDCVFVGKTGSPTHVLVKETPKVELPDYDFTADPGWMEFNQDTSALVSHPPVGINAIKQEGAGVETGMPPAFSRPLTPTPRPSPTGAFPPPIPETETAKGAHHVTSPLTVDDGASKGELQQASKPHRDAVLLFGGGETDKDSNFSTDAAPSASGPPRGRKGSAWLELKNAEGLTSVQLYAFLKVKASEEFGQQPTNEQHLRWKWKEYRYVSGLSTEHSAFVQRAILKCAYCNEKGCVCPFQLRVTRFGLEKLNQGQKTPGTDEGASFTVEQLDTPHTDHMMSAQSMGRLPLAMKASYTSSQLGASGRSVVAHYTNDLEATLTEGRQVALRRYHRRQKAAHNIQSTGLEPGEQHTFGGLHKVLNLLKPENRRVDGVMDMHTCYLLGEPVVQSSLEVPSFRGKHASLTVREQAEAAEAAGPRVCVALSTEALLLNGYRMTRQAMPMQVQVDTTWKLVKEGHGTIVVGTTAVDQAFHAIAYAVVSREDTIGHELVFAQIRDAVQAVVSKYGDEWK